MDLAVDRTLDFFVEFQALKLGNKGNPLDPTASARFFLIEFFSYFIILQGGSSAIIPQF